MKTKNACMLLLTAAIWGFAFVAQSVGMDYLGPFTFNAVRSLIGGITLLPFIALSVRKEDGKKAPRSRTLWLGGLCCGILLFAASSLQQIGIQYTTAGKAGFITACYIVLVPVLGILLKKKTGLRVWAAVVIALAGLYFLCMTERFTVGKGDVYLFLGAVLFALHILVIDHFSPRADGVRMACIQFFTCGLLSSVPMFLLETPKVSDILQAWAPILYAGVLSCGVAYTLQILGQKNVSPTIASLILSLESCISVLAGFIILGEKLSARELSGCVLMFGAIILAQIPEKKKKTLQEARNEESACSS
ncbi:DMT family transporter [Ruminococcus gauvreauii]|uniref:DMT family transporter n=1 Tax=Ruminococcus gauvreauii TaxID=438033 RepID=A0ABY5VGL4_9FIRM|nr:DMT family transporter [Ruminococcus gauvreauii]UWP59091.1 DMT family transporter [Ruminococcus gauvreauii]